MTMSIAVAVSSSSSSAFRRSLAAPSWSSASFFVVGNKRGQSQNASSLSVNSTAVGGRYRACNNVILSSAAMMSTDAHQRGAGGGGLVTTSIDEDGIVATLTLNRPPVNSMSLEMCQAISSEIKTIEKDHPDVHGLILSSSNPTILSAGLDIQELYQPDHERLSQFWHSFQQVFIDLYGSRLATIAAIRGHAPAGGCLLTLCCDYRIMASCLSTEKREAVPMIGLNETQLGIAAPFWMSDLFGRIVGVREAERALSLGMLYNPQQALDVGLIDDIVDDPDDVMSRAREEVAKWCRIPPKARVASKMTSRRKYIEELESRREDDVELFCSFAMSDEVQSTLGSYLEKLQSRKKQQSKL